MKIVFMGTPAFAVPTLDILLNGGHDIVGVITSTDKLVGRGRSKLLESDVKKYAQLKGLKILQPKNLKAKSFVEELKSLKAEIQVVVAFRMLPEIVWNMPPKGTINLHGSLLPKYRGAAPLNWALINGEKETGVTSFKLKHQIDTGDILMQKRLNIHHSDNVGSLHDRMMYLGAQVIAETLLGIENNTLSSKPQIDEKATPAPKIFPEQCEINFNDTSENVFNFIRGMSPYPGAWIKLTDGSTLKIFKVRPHTESHSGEVGKISTDDKSVLKISTTDGFVQVEELQLSGKRKMGIRSFLNGYKFNQ